MAATYVKFNQFVQDVAQKLHDLSSDSLKVLLTNTVPNIADTVVDTTTGTCTVKATSNAAEIAAGNGYTKGGNAVTITSCIQTSGVLKLLFTNDANAVFTASGSAMATFRYVVLYNNTAGTTATRPVIAWWDYGAGGVTLNPGETFTITWDQSNGVLTIT